MEAQTGISGHSACAFGSEYMFVGQFKDQNKYYQPTRKYGTLVLLIAENTYTTAYTFNIDSKSLFTGINQAVCQKFYRAFFIALSNKHIKYTPAEVNFKPKEALKKHQSKFCPHSNQQQQCNQHTGLTMQTAKGETPRSILKNICFDENRKAVKLQNIPIPTKCLYIKRSFL